MKTLTVLELSKLYNIKNRKKEAFGAVFLDPMINHDCLTDMNKVVKH
jgi:hypothetical protein